VRAYIGFEEGRLRKRNPIREKKYERVWNNREPSSRLQQAG
jgi:hypothetical protein